MILIFISSSFFTYSQGCLSYNGYEYLNTSNEYCDIDVRVIASVPDNIISNICDNTRKASMMISTSLFNDDTPVQGNFEICLEVSGIMVVDYSDYGPLVSFTEDIGYDEFDRYCVNYAFDLEADDLECKSFYIKPSGNYFPGKQTFNYSCTLTSSSLCGDNPVVLDFGSGSIGPGFEGLMREFITLDGNNLESNLGEVYPGTSGLYLKENSKWIIDMDYTRNPGPTLYPMFMDKGSSILVQSGYEFELRSAELAGCGEDMWNGIVLEDGADFKMNDVSISDAEKVLDVKGNSNIDITDSYFVDNYYNIYSKENRSSSEINFINFYNNEIGTFNEMLKRPNGSTPSRPHSGIYINRDGGMLDVSSSDDTKRNYYYDMSHGMNLNGSLFIANDNEIDDCNKGIKASNSYLWANDNMITNANRGIDLSRSGIWVAENTITASAHGVYSVNAQDRTNNIFTNSIISDAYGISQIYNFSGQLSHNDVDIPLGDHDHYGLKLWLSNGFTADHNNIDMDYGQAGIILQNSFMNRIQTDNVVTWTEQDSYMKGISVLSSPDNIIKQNDVLGPGFGGGATESVGLFIQDSQRGTYECNRLEDVEEGMWFLDNNDQSDFKGNVYENENGVGLKLNDQYNTAMTTTGKQYYVGNLWEDVSGAKAVSFNATGAINSLSAYAYDSGDNPGNGYKLAPDAMDIIGDNWFRDQSGITYTCSIFPIIPPGASNYDDYLEVFTSLDSVSSEEDWKYRYRVLEAILKRGVPYTMTESAFLNDHNGTVIKTLATVKNSLHTALMGDVSIKIDDRELKDSIESYLLSPDSLFRLQISDMADQVKITNAQADSIRKSSLSSLHATIKVLSPTSGIEADYVEATQLLLEGLLSDFNYNAAQILDLESLADECLWQRPESVYIARGLLNTLDDRTWDNNPDCGRNIPRSMVDQNQGVSDIHIYPNPVSQYLNHNMTGDIEIYNAQGQMVLRSHVTPGAKIDVTRFESGVYIIKQINDNRTTKFLKI